MRPDRPSAPARVLPSEIRMRTETDDGGFKVGVVIDKQSHGSPLLLGLEWIKPGTEKVSWQAPADAHEVYYVQQGRVLVGWDGESAGEVEVSAGESFYFPPALTYSLENLGNEEVFIVWSIVPSPS